MVFFLMIWKHKDSAYIYVGGLPFELTEGDLITIFSQYVFLHELLYWNKSC